ncbi:MAG: class I SAM-dependent methyltransferase [Methanomassiliicoccales archaeon]
MEKHGRAGVALTWLEGAAKILDLGCAEGLFTKLASDSGHDVIGVDVDRFSLVKAKSEAPGAEFIMTSGEAMPFSDSAFDMVVMLDVLEHVPCEEMTVKEIDRVLRPGGRLIVSVPNKGTFAHIDAQNSLIFAAGRKVIKNRGYAPWHKHYSLAELQRLLGESYKLVRLRYGGLLLFPLLGYVLMFTDSLRLHRLSSFFRKAEQVDFDKDYGERSWHLMAQFIKQDRAKEE